MNPRFLLLLAACAGTVTLPAQTPAVSAALDSLLKNPPFGQRPADGAAPATGAALELRGVFVDQGETFFSVYETSSRVSRWVSLNESNQPFTVRSYDAVKGEAKLDYQGREIALGLKQAKVVALAIPQPVPIANGPNPVPPGPTAIIPANGGPNDEATRLAAIAQEISRRRALRQQAMQPKPANPPSALPK